MAELLLPSASLLRIWRSNSLYVWGTFHNLESPNWRSWATLWTMTCISCLTITSLQLQRDGVKQARCSLKPKPYTEEKKPWGRGPHKRNERTHAPDSPTSKSSLSTAYPFLESSDLIWHLPLIPAHPVGHTLMHTRLLALHGGTMCSFGQHVGQWQVGMVLGEQQVQCFDKGVVLAGVCDPAGFQSRENKQDIKKNRSH